MSSTARASEQSCEARQCIVPWQWREALVLKIHITINRLQLTYAELCRITMRHDLYDKHRLIKMPHSVLDCLWPSRPPR